MRTRAYRPEVPGCLEGRQLLSSVAGRPAAPHVYYEKQFGLFLFHVGSEFDNYRRNRDIGNLRKSFQDSIILFLPFARAGGLPAKFEGIVDRMADDIHAHAPHPVYTAANEVVATARAEIKALVQAGDLVLR